jgi:uncharacterized protein YjlB
MPLKEDFKALVERISGVGRPQKIQRKTAARTSKPRTYRFKDDGETPNNPRLPLLIYRSAVRFAPALDPAAILEDLFASHGWKGSWRDSIYPYNHFHTRTHEVLGIARGNARVRFGGAKGRDIELKAGDVIVIPAGTGHRRMAKSKDLLVVGAYPRHGKYDEPRPSEVDHAQAVEDIAKVRTPQTDPIHGVKGPLKVLWRR